MKGRVVVGNLGTILRLFSVTLLIPVVFGFVLEPWTATLPGGLPVPGTTPAFLWTFAGTLLTGLLLERVGRPVDFRDREAYVLVGLGWISCTVVSAIPYMLTGTITDPTEAFFEAMSGLTTTGATLLPAPLETLPAGVHVWRALTQWLGGMGIVVLTVAVLSKLASAGARLMQAELPGGEVDRVRPSVVQTARSLFKIYAGLSLVLCTILFGLVLQQTGSWHTALLDAIVHTFTTMSTGGFSTRTISIEAFNNPWIETVILVFMLLAGTNFALTYRSVMTGRLAFFDDDEFRFFLGVIAGGTLLLTLTLFFETRGFDFWTDHGGRSLLTSLRLAAFQATSIVTTTGYSTADFALWSQLGQFLILFFMFTGGSTGSTGGSIKIARVLILFRTLKAELRRIAHPRAVLPIRLGREVIDSVKLQQVIVFLFAYLTLFLVGTAAVLALEPVSVIDGASAAAASIGNIGPALGTFGPLEGYAGLNPATHLLLAGLMWLGRLELFAVLVLFTPETYH